jgi:uncharacterized YccA/Bax inhibitor family protein
MALFSRSLFLLPQGGPAKIRLNFSENELNVSPMETTNPLLKRDIEFSAMEASGSMTLQGVINKTGLLLLLCMAAAFFSWTHPDLQGILLVVGIIGGLIACLAGTFVPKISPVAAPAYAVLEGLALGAVSLIFEQHYPGIVGNAMLLTFSVLGLMLFLYSFRIIRVTQRLMMGIMMATGAVALVYVIDMVMGMFGHHITSLYSSGALGIGISLVIVGIAAFNFLIDFAVIESNVQQGSPKYMEWYCGMALLVTLVWLYLEILRLLSKLQRRD